VNKPGKLFLLPVPIADEDGLRHLPEYNLEVARQLKHFIVEDAKTARKFLKLFSYPSIQHAEMHLLNEHSKPEEMAALLQELLNGNDVGLMSDAGCPGIADPGAEVVKLAHQKGIEVVPLAGPSSIVLSIMASGFTGQNFSFTGYLPVDRTQKAKRIRELEQLAIKQKQAQFFIETPYRNGQIFDALLATLAPQTSLFIGVNLLSPGQLVKSATVAAWKKAPRPELNKVPAVFGIFSC
jgi:16S rRNA (cytidine1402-2'-O)-methyltransferase